MCLFSCLFLRGIIILGFRYFTVETSDNFVFFRIPKVFFKDENFKSLCTDSKVLYGLMLDRMGLSRKNGWYDKNGHAYIYYSVASIQEDMGLSNKTVSKCLKELKELGLIKVVRQGLTKNNIIYVMDFSRPAPDAPDIPEEDNTPLLPNEPDDSSVDDSSAGEERAEAGEAPWESYDPGASQKDTLDYAAPPQDIPPGKARGKTRDKPTERDYANTVLEIKQNISYERLLQKYNSPTGHRIVEGVVALLADILCFPGESVVINKTPVPYDVVRTKLEQVECDHVEYVLDNILKGHNEIKNYKSYLLSSLYNSVDVLDLHYRSGGFF